MEQVLLPVKVNLLYTQVGDQQLSHKVIMGTILDEYGNDVTRFEQFPLIGTKLKTVAFTAVDTNTIFDEVVINANVRILPVRLRKFIQIFLKIVKSFSFIFAANIFFKSVLQDMDKTNPVYMAIKAHNKPFVDNHPIVKDIEADVKDEMFRNLEVMGTIVINGKNHLLLRVKFNQHALIFFDISQELNISSFS